jgi:hypothetical protein
VISWSAGQHSKKILRETTTRESRDEFVLREKKKKQKKTNVLDECCPLLKLRLVGHFQDLGLGSKKNLSICFHPFRILKLEVKLFSTGGMMLNKLLVFNFMFYLISKSQWY